MNGSSNQDISNTKDQINYLQMKLNLIDEAHDKEKNYYLKELKFIKEEEDKNKNNETAKFNEEYVKTNNV
jgi:hypothetical protein